MNAKMKVYVTVVGFSCWMVDFVGKAHATWVIPNLPWLNKRSSENERERVSLTPKSQSFQTTLFLPATCPLSRLAWEGWGEGGSADCTNLIWPKLQKPPQSQPSPAGRGKGQVAVAATCSVGFAHEMNAEMKAYVTVVWFELSGGRFRGQSPRYLSCGDWIKGRLKTGILVFRRPFYLLTYWY